ncbi:hypothetical protein ABH926_010232 [Catenulispora sp. GP43]|uniref:SSI family serine proteinase inhibitor n=1 Tax=Catenulispora sp. GP43 TaxID=3156263 RepID=UPI0035155C9D
MRRLAAVTATAFLSAAALSAGAATAQAANAHATPRFTVHVLGSVHLKRVDRMNGRTRTAYLLCTSTSTHGSAPVIHGLGGLKDATSACEELAAVHGRLDTLAVHPAWMAPALEAPVEVQAAGTWEGRKVAWTHRFPNGGWVTKATGDVFAF